MKDYFTFTDEKHISFYILKDMENQEKIKQMEEKLINHLTEIVTNAT